MDMKVSVTSTFRAHQCFVSVRYCHLHTLRKAASAVSSPWEAPCPGKNNATVFSWDDDRFRSSFRGEITRFVVCKQS
eukprot:scaffold2476_cov193-Amphora_coffeaeformis.AAC.9